MAGTVEKNEVFKKYNTGEESLFKQSIDHHQREVAALNQRIRELLDCVADMTIRNNAMSRELGDLSQGRKGVVPANLEHANRLKQIADRYINEMTPKEDEG